MAYSRWYDIAGFITCSSLSGYIVETNTSLTATLFKWALELSTIVFILHFLGADSDDD